MAGAPVPVGGLQHPAGSAGAFGPGLRRVRQARHRQHRPPPEPRTPTGYIVAPIGPTFTGKAAVFQDMLYPRGQSYRVTPTYK